MASQPRMSAVNLWEGAPAGIGPSAGSGRGGGREEENLWQSGRQESGRRARGRLARERGVLGKQCVDGEARVGD
eukprot:scaffold129585_cov31-Tisochrysis_lutea.AAC.3